jgi:hypothetical protein
MPKEIEVIIKKLNLSKLFLWKDKNIFSNKKFRCEVQ